MEAILNDTEVNSLTAQEPIEVAYAEWSFESGMGEIKAKRFRPVEPISAGAAIVHGILDCDLSREDDATTARQFVPKAEYWVGQNIDFDAGVMKQTEAKRICTLALSRSIWPEFECHKLGALVYELRGMTPETRELLTDAHAAGKDVELLRIVLDAIVMELGVSSVPSLYAASEKARIPTVMPLGKHKGMRIDELPSDYVQWLLRQDWLDQYLRMALI